MPTFLDFAGGRYPEDHHGNKPIALEGMSLRSALQGQPMPNRALYFEHSGNAAVRVGPWKLVRAHRKPWELYHLGRDRTEINNLAGAEPKRVEAMAAQWQAWAQRVGVQPWPLKKK
jgi:arylsulfatase